MTKGALTGRDGLIFAGIRNLKEYGYPDVSPKNILTDMIYKEFFRTMLEENLGKLPGMDKDIKSLLNQIGRR